MISNSNTSMTHKNGNSQSQASNAGIKHRETQQLAIILTMNRPSKKNATPTVVLAMAAKQAVLKEMIPCLTEGEWARYLRESTIFKAATNMIEDQRIQDAKDLIDFYAYCKEEIQACQEAFKEKDAFFKKE